MSNSDESSKRVTLMHNRLIEALTPNTIEIVDESSKHKNHEQAKISSGGHYCLNIVSNDFEDRTQIERHRMIYSALGDAMGKDIHALSINALSPNEIES